MLRDLEVQYLVMDKFNIKQLHEYKKSSVTVGRKCRFKYR